MILFPMHKARHALWLGCVLVLFQGCGSSAPPADPAAAQAVLRTALDAWKAGGKPGDLATKEQPIKVSDQEWAGGWTLVDYRADEQGKLVGFDMNYPVDLVLKKPDGRSVNKKAVYTVTTQPEALILRQEG